jgi:hypothetical protein
MIKWGGGNSSPLNPLRFSPQRGRRLRKDTRPDIPRECQRQRIRVVRRINSPFFHFFLALKLDSHLGVE